MRKPLRFKEDRKVYCDLWWRNYQAALSGLLASDVDYEDEESLNEDAIAVAFESVSHLPTPL